MQQTDGRTDGQTDKSNACYPLPMVGSIIIISRVHPFHLKHLEQCPAATYSYIKSTSLVAGLLYACKITASQCPWGFLLISVVWYSKV